MKFISIDCRKWNIESLQLFFKCYFILLRINHRSYDVAFCKFKSLKLRQIYLNFVIEVNVIIGPRSPICTDHIGSVAKCAKIKSIVLRCYYLLVANSNGNPIRVTLLNFEMESFVSWGFLNIRIHDCKFVPRTILRLDNMIRN